jgi:mRNA interferase HigB
MQLVNLLLLSRASRKFPAARKPLEEWAQTVQASVWTSLQEVRRTYPGADGVAVRSGGIITVFNIGGNKYRLLTSIFYGSQRLYLIEFLTHAEYTKGRWKDRL